MPKLIHYPDIHVGPENGELVFERLVAGEELHDPVLMTAIDGLKAVAYARQLEGSGENMLRPGTMEAWRLEMKQRRNMAAPPARTMPGSTAWITRSPSDRLQLDGIVRTRLMQPVYDPESIVDVEDDDRIYINDIIARDSRKGVGSAALHAAIHTLWEGDQLWLDGYKGSSVNEWYKRIGFRKVGMGGDVQIGDQSLETERFVGITGAIREALEKKHPALKTAYIA